MLDSPAIFGHRKSHEKQIPLGASYNERVVLIVLLSLEPRVVARDTPRCLDSYRKIAYVSGILRDLGRDLCKWLPAVGQSGDFLFNFAQRFDSHPATILSLFLAIRGVIERAHLIPLRQRSICVGRFSRRI